MKEPYKDVLPCLNAISFGYQSMAKTVDRFQKLVESLEAEEVRYEPIYKDRSDKSIESLPVGYVINYKKNGENHIIVAYRGTRGMSDIIKDAKSKKQEDEKIGARIHSGFLDLYRESSESLKAILTKLQTPTGSPIKNVTFTGHSMGGALAQIAALDNKNIIDPLSISIKTFGSPRVFDQKSAKKYNEIFEDKTLHFQLSGDLAPRIFSEKLGFKRTGKKIVIKSDIVHGINKYQANIIRESKPQEKTESNYRFIDYYESVKNYVVKIMREKAKLLSQTLRDKLSSIKKPPNTPVRKQEPTQRSIHR